MVELEHAKMYSLWKNHEEILHGIILKVVSMLSSVEKQDTYIT